MWSLDPCKEGSGALSIASPCPAYGGGSRKSPNSWLLVSRVRSLARSLPPRDAAVCLCPVLSLAGRFSRCILRSAASVCTCIFVSRSSNGFGFVSGARTDDSPPFSFCFVFGVRKGCCCVAPLSRIPFVVFFSVFVVSCSSSSSSSVLWCVQSKSPLPPKS